LRAKADELAISATHPASTERRADGLHILPGLSGGVPQKGLSADL
jgi:hypothetical protein